MSSARIASDLCLLSAITTGDKTLCNHCNPRHSKLVGVSSGTCDDVPSAFSTNEYRPVRLPNKKDSRKTASKSASLTSKASSSMGDPSKSLSPIITSVRSALSTLDAGA